MSPRRALLLGLVLFNAPLSVLCAQTAPELQGHVREISGTPINAALIELVEAGVNVWSTSAGVFRLRAPEAGAYTVRITRIGYAPRTFNVRLEAGRVSTLVAELVPHAVEVDRVVITATAANEGTTLTRAAILQSGGVTAADAIASVPGVVLVASTPGGPQRVSIRGADPRQVLVLLDGVPLNDPITGEADLSRVRAEAIERVTVLPGGGTARFGARAVGGVIAIESRAPGRMREASVSAGSLGSVSGSLSAGGAGAVGWFAGLSANRQSGAFEYELPAQVGGLHGVRANADAHTADAFAQMHWQGEPGQLRVRAGVQKQERGMPGTAFAPSLYARQHATALRLSGQWDTQLRSAGATALFGYNREVIRFADAAPPAGLPYDDTISLNELYGRVGARSTALPITIGVAVEGHWYDIETATLESGIRAPGSISLATELQWPSNRWWSAQAQLRLDRDHAQARTYASHALSIGFDRAVHFRLTQRSSYAPPTLADQHFRESFGVAANPALRAERVPNEVEAALSWSHAFAETNVRAQARAWSGNTDDLIVWMPDYRFVWSPRNTDVLRRGGDASATIGRGPFTLDAGWSYTQVTYRNLAGDVQVLYRPRHSGSISLQAASARWQARIESRYIGARTTAPTRLNTLPGFWTVNTSASARTPLRGFLLETRISVDRLNNEQESLIFGFPQPTRVLRLELRIAEKVSR